MIKIGFTGTRKGMTSAQKKTFYELLSSYLAVDFHHGDCIGAYAEAHDMVVALGCRTIIHQPDNDSARAFKQGDVMRSPLPYLDRNKQIVNSTQLLIATPETAEETLRSGTWSTVRYACKSPGMMVYVILPDGKIDKRKD